MFSSAAQHLVIAAAMAVSVAAVCRMGRLGPVARHALWLVVLVKLATPPVFVVRTPWAWPDLPRTAAAPAPVAIADAADEGARAIPGSDGPGTPPPTLSASTPVLTTNVPWTFIALAVWLAGGVVFAGIQAVRIVRLSRLLRRAQPPNRALAARVEGLARRMRMPSISIHVVPGLASPLVWAIPRPALLWPAALPEGLSDACLDGLIVHELAHVQRRDHWVSWIELVAGVVWWWNPLFWYVRSQVREHAELACDARVVDALPHGRRAYAEALVAVCDIIARRAVPVPAVGVSTGGRRVLERRLVMIMRGHVSSRLSRIGCVSIAMLIAVSLPAWAQRRTSPTPSTLPTPTTLPIVTMPADGVPQGARPGRGVTVPAEVPRDGQKTPVPLEVAAEPPRQTLPADAQKLIDRFAQQQAEARREADAKIALQRQDLIKQLQAMQETFTKAGKLDEAVAVRDEIRRLQSTGSSASAPGWAITTPARSGRLSPFWTTAPVTPATRTRSVVLSHRRREPVDLLNRLILDREGSAPGTLTSFRDHVGATFTVPVIGATDGSVWGNGVYTDDSVVAVAAVHAGVVQPGKLGFVRITILPGRESYEGSESHGVTSQAFGSFEGSYRIERDPDSAPVVHLTGALDASPFLSLASFRGHPGVTFTAEVVGSDGTVWGTDVYTDDSSISAAAVHAGLLKVGERGFVKVTVLPGQEKYTGSERNGVKSDAYGAWDGSFRLDRVNKGRE